VRPETIRISKLYQNEKVGEIFINTSFGQDMIDMEIEKNLTFSEIREIDVLRTLGPIYRKRLGPIRIKDFSLKNSYPDFYFHRWTNA
jgi:hypothetical protein